MSFLQYNSARSATNPDMISTPRDFRHAHNQHGGAAMDTIQSYASGDAMFKPNSTTFDRLPPYMPMSTTTSGFDPTSVLPYPFANNFADLSGNVGGGNSGQPAATKVNFPAVNGYCMGSAAEGLGSLPRYAPAECRTNPGFLQSERGQYVNGGVQGVSLSSAVDQQMSPPSVTTPISPTDIVYPWMTIVGKSISPNLLFYCRFNFFLFISM